MTYPKLLLLVAVVFGPLLLAALLYELNVYRVGIKKFRLLVEARGKLFRAESYLAADFDSYASVQSTGLYQPRHVAALGILWELIDRINEEIEQLDGPIWMREYRVSMLGLYNKKSPLDIQRVRKYIRRGLAPRRFGVVNESSKRKFQQQKERT